MNNLKTFILMAGLMGLFLLAGQLLGGSQGLLLAALFGFAFNFGMYFFRVVWLSQKLRKWNMVFVLCLGTT